METSCPLEFVPKMHNVKSVEIGLRLATFLQNPDAFPKLQRTETHSPIEHIMQENSKISAGSIKFYSEVLKSSAEHEMKQDASPIGFSPVELTSAELEALSKRKLEIHEGLINTSGQLLDQQHNKDPSSKFNKTERHSSKQVKPISVPLYHLDSHHLLSPHPNDLTFLENMLLYEIKEGLINTSGALIDHHYNNAILESHPFCSPQLPTNMTYLENMFFVRKVSLWQMSAHVNWSIQIGYSWDMWRPCGMDADDWGILRW